MSIPKHVKHLAQRIVVSRLDHGNALLCGISLSLLSRLQIIKNRAARRLIRTRNTAHNTCFVAVTRDSSEVQIVVQYSTLPILNNEWTDPCVPPQSRTRAQASEHAAI